MHGSADDIAGKNIVNPLATLRAIADITETQLGVNGFQELMESILAKAEDQGFITPSSVQDVHRGKTTSEVVSYVIKQLRKSLPTRIDSYAKKRLV